MYSFSLTKPLEFQGNTVRQSSRQTGSYDPQSDSGAAWPEHHENSWKTEHLIKNNHKDSAIFSTSACSTDRSWMGRSMLLFCSSSTAWLILVMQHLNQRYYWWQKKKKMPETGWRRKFIALSKRTLKLIELFFGGFQPVKPICGGILGEVSEARNIFFP